MEGLGKKELSDEYRTAHQGLRRLFLDARRLARSRLTLPPIRVQQQRLEARLFAWGASP